ncbi:hypothetical protein [Schaalia sp. Marseille-Q2122]|uniref:hypothetical protein n=1 Tax=Schaalia sp. Marseille-Q2122 TaxID=2736604 RepID=UPI0015887B4D|nr:hypothetical protein [Schaalia sp. Marseille-Q2122]
MPEQPHDLGQGQRPARRVSMVPLHSPYPRTPYAAQKNTAAALLGRRSPGAGLGARPARPGTFTLQAKPQTATPASTPHTRNSAEGRTSRKGSQIVDSGTVQHNAQSEPQTQAPVQLSGPPPSPQRRGRSRVQAQQTPSLTAGAHPSGMARLPEARTSATTVPTGITPTPAGRVPRTATAGGRPQPVRKAKNTLGIAIVIIVFVLSFVPRLVEYFTADEPWRDAVPMLEEVTGDGDSDIELNADLNTEDTTVPSPYARPQEPYFAESMMEYRDKLPAQQSGSRETPLHVGERISVKDVALTVTDIQRGDNAARAAFYPAPPGYEYVLVDIRFENPKDKAVSLEPVLMRDDDYAFWPVSLKEGEDFRWEAKPNSEGILEGRVVFLVEDDDPLLLMFYSYEDGYPIVFYALP